MFPMDCPNCPCEHVDAVCRTGEDPRGAAVSPALIGYDLVEDNLPYGAGYVT